jgi:hypothetical protein
MSKAPPPLLRIDITFPNSPKHAKDRKSLLKKLKSWIREEKKMLSIEEISFERNSVSLSREEFFWAAKFQKPISTVLAVRDPEKNIELANDFGNKIMNYLKIILEKFAMSAELNTEMQDFSTKIEGLAKNLIGETRLARINEITKMSFLPLGIAFEYEKGERSTIFFAVGKEDVNALYITSSLSLKDTLPWDVVLSEYREIKECEQILTKLAKQEI